MLSVIIPTHNMVPFLPGAIESIIENTFQDLELIIIDDGSTDNTEEIAAHFRENSTIPIRYYKCPHRGKAACLNAIFDSVDIRGDYIAFMDADDLLPADSLQNRYKAITSANADMLIGEFDIITRQGTVLDHRKLDADMSTGKLMDGYFYRLKSPFHLNGCLIKKELLLKTGRFDERLERGQEVDYAIRLLKNAEKVTILPRIVYRYQKYYRPLPARIKLRLKTMRCRLMTLLKHLSGVKLITAALLHMVYDMAKLGFEVFWNYE